MRETPIRGLLHIAILGLVRGGPTHGSEIHRTLKSKLGVETSKPIIYGLLRRMENLGFLSSTWDVEGGGPAKRVYRITEEGLEHLQNSLEGLRKVKGIIDRMIAINTEAK